MAKNFEAKLSMNSNPMIQALEKAVEATKELKDNLKKISNQPVNIKAKLDSSFKNVQSQINKVAPKSKTVRFSAKEDVTRTMSNVERQMFNFTRNIDTNMKGFSSNIKGAFSGALPAINKMQRAMNAVTMGSNMSRMLGRGAMASGIAAEAIGSAVGTRSAIATIGRRSINKNVIANPLDKPGSGANKKGPSASMGAWFDRWKKAIAKMPSVLKGPFSAALNKVMNNDLVDDIASESILDRMNALNKKYGKGKRDEVSLGKRRFKKQEYMDEYGDTQDDGWALMDGPNREVETFRQRMSRLSRTIQTDFRLVGSRIAMMFEPITSRLRGFRERVSTLARTIQTDFRLMGARIAIAFEPVTNKIKAIGRAIVKIKDSFMYNVQMAGLRAFATVHRAAFKTMEAIATATLKIHRAFTRVKEAVVTAFNRIKNSGTKTFAQIEAEGGSRMIRLASKMNSAFTRSTRLVKAGFTKSFSEIYRSGASRFGKLGMAIGRVLSLPFISVKRKSDGTTEAVKRKWVSAVGQIGSTIRRVLSSAFGSVAGMASGAASKFRSVFSTAAKAVGAAITAAMAIGVKGMINQEQSLVSMNHFIKVGDAKKNGKRTKTDQQTAKEAQNFMDSLTTLADNTPSDTFDIYNAGRRAVQVTEGDTKQAYDITKLASDMSALNHGKTVQDAMEALADLKLGETERMKEFGFKLSQKDLKGMIGKKEGDDLTGKDLEKVFAKLTKEGGEVFKTFNGGAADLANTLGGKFSTAWGTFKTMMAKAMKPFDKMFKGILDKVIKKIADIGPALTEAFGMGATFMEDLFNGDSTRFPIIENLVNAFKEIKSAVGPILDTLGKQLEKVGKTIEKSFGGAGKLIEGAGKVIGKVLKAITPALELLAPAFETITKAVEAVVPAVEAAWPIIEDIIEVGSLIIKDCLEALNPVIEAIGRIFKVVADSVKEAWPEVRDTVLTVWENLKPVLELLGDLASGIAWIFENVWPGISTVISAVWSVAGPVIELFCDALGGLARSISEVCEWFSRLGTWMSESWVADVAAELKPGNWFDGKDNKWNDKPDGSHATGLNRVPKDNYKAILHQGERVLTAEESRKLDKKENNSASNVTATFNIYEAQDADKVARTVVAELEKYSFA